MGATTHGRFSPSQLYRVFRCPGSVRLCDAAPARASSSYAVEGTKAHEVLTIALQKGFIPAQEAFDLSPYFFEDFWPDFFDAIEDCIQLVREVCNEMPDATLYVDTRVNVPCTVAPGEADGTLDIALLGKTKLVVIDYKHGAGVVEEAEDNPQLLSYAAGFVFGETTKHLCADVEEIELVICQPRAFHDAGAVRTHTVTRKKLQGHLNVIDYYAEQALEDDAVLVPGKKQCQFCDANTTCPALESRALDVVPNTFASVRDVTAPAMPDPASMTAERLGYVLQAGELLKTWLSACEQHALQSLREGYVVPGKKAVYARARREWFGNEQEIADKLAALAGTKDKDKFYPRKLVTLGEAEKLVKKAFKASAGRKQAKEAAKDANDALAALTVKKSSNNIVLADETDSRPAVNLAHASFASVTVPVKEN